MNFGVFFQLSSDGVVPWWQFLLNGMAWTLVVAVGAATLAFVLGSLLGVARTVESVAVRRCATVYVEIFRSIPLVVQFFVWYYLLPEVLPALKALVLEAEPAQVQLAMAILCLGSYSSARVAEQVRAGIQAQATSRRYAGYALGLTQWQTYRYVLLPVTYRSIIAPLTSEAMSLVKNTSVAYSIGLAELFFRTLDMGETTFRYFEAFVASAVGYMTIALIIVFIMGRLDRRYAIPGTLSRKPT